MPVSYSFSIAKRCLVSWNSRTKKKETPSLDRDKASPPSPLRMERGVDSIVCKQRGRFFTSKRRPFHGKETPSSKWRRRLFVFSSTIPANEGQLCNTETIWYIAFSKLLLQTEVIIIWIMNYDFWIAVSPSRWLKACFKVGDGRPRLETPPSLPQGEEHLTVTYLNDSFYPKGCHKVGTDALVCPHRGSCL